jgi:hypothetical protein
MSSIKIERHGGSSGMVQTMTTPSGDTLYGGGSDGWFTTEREVFEGMFRRISVTIDGYKTNVKGRKDAVSRRWMILDALAALPEEGE